jgi:hypothetical protein
VLVVIGLDRRVDSERDGNFLNRTALAMNHEPDVLKRCDSVFDAKQIETLAAVESQRCGTRIVFEL